MVNIVVNIPLSLLRRPTRDAGFDESKHPRASNGQFGEGGGGEKSKSFERSDSEKWDVGSGKIPKGSVWIDTPFPIAPPQDNPLVVLGPMRSEAFDKTGKGAAETREVKLSDLKVWQDGVDPAKLRPLDNPPPIHVGKINGQLVVMNGNHRAVSALVEGRDTILAKVADYDDPANKKYWKKRR